MSQAKLLASGGGRQAGGGWGRRDGGARRAPSGKKLGEPERMILEMEQGARMAARRIGNGQALFWHVAASPAPAS